jgi:dipeptidyl aminopeptidase/acylaminoacyl peptidase
MSLKWSRALLKRGTALLLLALAAPLFAQLPALIPREVLFGNPEKASPQISPDGKYLAYLAPKDGVLNVWVRTVGKNDDRVVTDDKKRGIRAYFWAEDNVNLLYIQDKDGDENWHLYAVDYKATTPTTRDLTPHEGVQARVVAADPNFPNELLIGLNIRDKRFHDVYRLNLPTGASTLEVENPGDVAGWLTDHKFQVRGAYASTPEGGFQLRLREDAKSEWKPFITWGPDDNASGPRGFTPDGTGLYLADSREANALRLVEIDIATGKQKVLAEDPQYDMGGLIIHPRKYHAQAVAFTKERTNWQILDKSIEADYHAIRKIHDGDFFLINRDDADKTWLVGFTSDHGPVPYYAYDRTTKKATFLFTNRPA